MGQKFRGKALESRIQITGNSARLSSVTRIVAGEKGGLRLNVPKSGTRPTSERVREAMFSHLLCSGFPQGAMVLDLFAGSGALGLEALSRGGASAVFVDASGTAAKVLRANIDALHYRDRARVLVKDAAKFVSELKPTDCFDLIFLDPPYALAPYVLSEILAGLTAHLSPEGVMVLETSKKFPAPEIPSGLQAYAAKSYGDTLVTYLQQAQG